MLQLLYVHACRTDHTAPGRLTVAVAQHNVDLVCAARRLNGQLRRTRRGLALYMDADGKRWRALADYLIKHMAERQQLLAATVDGI